MLDVNQGYFSDFTGQQMQDQRDSYGGPNRYSTGDTFSPTAAIPPPMMNPSDLPIGAADTMLPLEPRDLPFDVYDPHNHNIKMSKFDNIGGLKPRAPVRSAGVVVGRVKSISLDSKTYQGLVRMEIDNHVKFPKDSSAKILTSGLLGEQYIGLEPGGETAMLGNGDTIQLTQSAVVLENLIGQMLYGRAGEGGK